MKKIKFIAFAAASTLTTNANPLLANAPTNLVKSKQDLCKFNASKCSDQNQTNDLDRNIEDVKLDRLIESIKNGVSIFSVSSEIDFFSQGVERVNDGSTGR